MVPLFYLIFMGTMYKNHYPVGGENYTTVGDADFFDSLTSTEPLTLPVKFSQDTSDHCIPDIRDTKSPLSDGW